MTRYGDKVQAGMSVAKGIKSSVFVRMTMRYFWYVERETSKNSKFANRNLLRC